LDQFDLENLRDLKPKPKFIIVSRVNPPNRWLDTLKTGIQIIESAEDSPAETFDDLTEDFDE
jgi:hypothetical protein